MPYELEFTTDIMMLKVHNDTCYSLLMIIMNISAADLTAYRYVYRSVSADSPLQHALQGLKLMYMYLHDIVAAAKRRVASDFIQNFTCPSVQGGKQNDYIYTSKQTSYISGLIHELWCSQVYRIRVIDSARFALQIMTITLSEYREQ